MAVTDERLVPAPVGSKEGHHLQLSNAGVVMPAQLGDMIEFAKIMSKADVAIPKHLRGNPGACLAVAMRSRAWAMDPFAVATKTYAVNDILSYESQLINAVINRHAPIKGRLVPVYKGEGPERQCVLEPETTDGQVLPYQSPKVKDIKVKNSPLWAADPDQQLFYTSSRAWARRYFPELLMGVYDPDEAREMKDVTPQPVDNFLNDDEPVKAGPGTVEHDRVAYGVSFELNGQRVDPMTVQETGMPIADLKVELEPGLMDEPEAPDLTPELIASNLEKAIAGCLDKAALKDWEAVNAKAVADLPEPLRRRVRKAASDRFFDLDEA